MLTLVDVGGRNVPITLDQRCALLSRVLVYESIKNNV